MTSAWGVAPDANGNGTTPEDIQRIIAAQYSTDGIVAGGFVTGTATMSYDVSSGAVVLNTGQDMAVIVPVTATSVPTDPAPATGSRTDIIYVKQNFPGTDGSSNAFVGVTSGALPANSVEIGRYNVPAGITATTAATSTANRRYAVPVGSSKGRLVHYNGDAGGVQNSTTESAPRGSSSFYVETDRDVRITMDSTIVASTSGGSIDTAGRGGVMYYFYVDGQFVKGMEREYNRTTSTWHMEFTHAVTEGSHTVHYTTKKTWSEGAGYWKPVKGGTNKHLGDEFRVWDAGVINW